MQKKRFWIVVLCSALMTGEAFPAVTTSFLVPLRTAIMEEIEFISSDVTTSNAVALRPLIQARRALNRRTRPSLTSDIQMLAAAAAVLNRSEYADFFAPVVEDAIFSYSVTLDETEQSLAATLETLPRTPQVMSAERSLGFVGNLRERADAAPNAEIAARLLSRVALQLTALQSTVARLSRNSTGALTSFTAFINGDSFTSDTITSANFNSGVGALTLSGTQNSGLASRTLTLSLRNVRPGTTTHQLSGIAFGSYGVYSQRGTNNASYTSVSGSAVVTMDTASRTVSGTFSFVGSSRSAFDVPVQVSSGNFTLPLR